MDVSYASLGTFMTNRILLINIFFFLFIKVLRAGSSEQKVSTIPPIYKRSTASNISFEEGGEFNLPFNQDDDLFQESKKCSRPSKVSPASHGVRSRPVDSGVVFGETPLLSPLTETEFLKEVWPTDLFATLKTDPTSLAVVKDNSVFPIWEENYQDLSGWCMDPFRGACAFPLGEFDENRHSGTKNEDFGVSINKEGIVGREPRGFPVEKKSLEELSFVVHPQISDTGQEVPLQAVKAETAVIEAIDLDDVLLNPTQTSITMGTEDWIQLANVKETNDSSISKKQESQGNDNCNIVSADYLSPIHLELAKNDNDNWDSINTFDNTGSNAFDLLSYLCDDDNQSPENSSSRDSDPTTNSNASVTSPSPPDARTIPTISRNTRTAEDVDKNYNEASTSSASSIAAISAAIDSVTKMSRRKSRMQKRSFSRNRNDSESSTRERAKKRCVDSDSEDRMSDCSYRESREKNNEASRKSRMNKKAKETEMMTVADELERDNRILKMKVEELEKLVTSMRSAILLSALKKSSRSNEK